MHLRICEKFEIGKYVLGDSEFNRSQLAKNGIGRSRRTIVYHQKKILRDGIENYLTDKYSRNRKPAYSSQDELNILSFFNDYPFATLKDSIAFCNLNYSTSTIRRLLLRNGINTFTCKRVPYLKLEHQTKR